MRAALTLVVCVWACTRTAPPAGQIVLFIDTDAPLPSSQNDALFDRVQIDVFAPNEEEPCAGCSRTMPLDSALVAAGHASIGLPLPADTPGYRARLRLYAGRSTLSGQVPEKTSDGKPPQSVVDLDVLLPAVSKTGVIEHSVFLATDKVGQPTGPIATTPGRITHADTWAGAKRIPCAGEATLDEVCIPGGAFWMGNPHSISVGQGDRADRSKLVVVAPYYLQRTEVTVAQFRLFGPKKVIPWSGSTSGDATNDYCTYTAEAGPNEDKPLNCASWEDARAYCVARGGDLPTEAQLEYAAGGFASHLYVWGEEDPMCGDMVYGRSGYGFFATVLAPCKPPMAPGGPLEVGLRVVPPRRDRLWTGTGTVFDLLGNVAEYALDEFQQQDSVCWSGGGVYRDPLCQNGSGVHTVKGGDWISIGNLVIAASRFGVDPTQKPVTVGFRCARPG